MAAAPTPAESLTASERFLITLVADGLTNLQAAVLMGTTENVVKNKLQVVFDKLGFDSRLEVALWHVRREHLRRK